MKKIQGLGALAFLFTTLTLFASPELRLSDGTTTVTVVDGDANDQAPDPGVVFYNGPVGLNWTINVTVGVTKPSDGTASEPYIDLDTESLSQKAGDLKIEWTDTDFTATSGTWDAQVGGNTDGSVDFKYFLDSNNTPFGTNVALADFPNQVDVYAAESNGTFSITAPYSMTVQALIHHNGRGATGFDESLQLTPPQFQPPSIQCSGDVDLGCNPTTIPSCDTNSVTITASCGVSNVTCAAAGPDTVTGCVHERDLVYTVTDNCGLSASCTQHIFWTVDHTPPSFSQCPSDMDLGCNPATIPDCNLSITATDDCGKAFVSCSPADSVDGCRHTRTLTYVATDACGNKATCVQHITWTADTTPPAFQNCLGDQELGCNPLFIPDCNNTPAPTATDNCGDATVSCSSSDSSHGCSNQRTITYIATDKCGNTASCVRHITWTVDTVPPAFSKCPGDSDLGCNPTFVPDCNPTDANTVAATDDCSLPVITCSKKDSVSGCSHTRTVTYVATDGCGNSSTCVQNITWTENTTPPMLQCPPDMTLCANDIVPGADPTLVNASDDCGIVHVTYLGATTNGTCPQVISRTYQATDACGNINTCTQTITVNCQPPCTLVAPVPPPSCQSSGNTLSGPSGNFTYSWTISAPAGSGWAITSATNIQTITYSSGTSGTVATFTLKVTDKGTGCNNTCMVTFGCACPPCVDPIFGLSPTTTTVFQLGTGQISITGPPGGIVGDIWDNKGKLSITGSEFVTGTIHLGVGATFANSSSGTIGPVVTGVDMSAQVAAAYTAYSNNIAKSCTQTYTTIDGKTVKSIVGVAGLNVICVKDISLNGTQVTLSGPAGAKFLFKISGKMSLNGGGSGPQIRVVSPIAPQDVLYTLVGTGEDVAFTGGGGGANCCAAIVDGTILAPFRKISLSPGLVNGEIISGLDISIVSGSSVRCPTCQ